MPIPNKYLGRGYKGLVFCRNNGWIWLDNGKHGRGTHSTKMGADIVWPKIPQMPQNLSAHFVCPSPKVLDYNEKKGFIVRP